MARRNFSKQVKIACVKRAMKGAVIYCEECGLPCKRYEIDHVIADGIGGEPILENAKLLCEPCHDAKTKNDVAIIAKAKRVEAKHIGVTRPKQTIKNAGFLPIEKSQKIKDKMPIPPRRDIFTRKVY